MEMRTTWPNTSLEPTPITPVSLRRGFRVGGSRRQRGSILGRRATTTLGKNSTTNQRKHIETGLIKLSNWARLLRIADRASGLSLQKRLDPVRSVVRQKQQFSGMLKPALAQAQEVAV
jgi:hypothetical protein